MKITVRWESDLMLTEIEVNGEKKELCTQEDPESEEAYKMLKARIIDQAEEEGYPVENSKSHR